LDRLPPLPCRGSATPTVPSSSLSPKVSTFIRFPSSWTDLAPILILFLQVMILFRWCHGCGGVLCWCCCGRGILWGCCVGIVGVHRSSCHCLIRPAASRPPTPGGTAAAGGVVSARWTAGKLQPGTNAGGQDLGQACLGTLDRLPPLPCRSSATPTVPSSSLSPKVSTFIRFPSSWTDLAPILILFFAGHDPVPVVSWLWWSPLLVLLWSWHPLGLLCWYCWHPPKLLPLSNTTCCITSPPSPQPIGRSHLNPGYFP
jgi:hypothetical protein